MEQQLEYYKKMNHYSKTEKDLDQEEIEDDASLFVYPIESSCAAEDEQFYEVVELELVSSWIVAQKLMLCR